MQKHSLARKMILIAMLLITACLLTGCYGNITNPVAPAGTPLPPMEAKLFEDKAAATALYSKVELGDTKAAVDEKLGEGEENKTPEGSKFYNYRDGDYGVSLTFDSMDKVFGKVLLYDDIRQLSPLTPKPLEGAAYAISKGSKYGDAVELLGGEAIEIATARHAQTDGSEILTSLIMWIGEDGATLQGTLDSELKFTEVIYRGIEQPEE